MAALVAAGKPHLAEREGLLPGEHLTGRTDLAAQEGCPGQGTGLALFRVDFKDCSWLMETEGHAQKVTFLRKAKSASLANFQPSHPHFKDSPQSGSPPQPSSVPRTESSFASAPPPTPGALRKRQACRPKAAREDESGHGVPATPPGSTLRPDLEPRLADLGL